MRGLVVLAALGVLAGCSPAGTTVGGSTISAASSTRSATGARIQAASVYGVLVELLADSRTYTISVVAPDGTVAARIEATPRSLPPDAVVLPYVSTTSTALYYLVDGDEVWKLDLNGLGQKPRLVAQVKVPTGTELALAVSPDDTKVAYSLVDFRRTPVHVTVTTSSIGGGLGHVIYESDTNYVWPVAWHNGQLVLAHGYGVTFQDALKAAPGQDNPYWAISYHMVDPATASRTGKIGEACTVSGPLSPAGSACIQGGTEDWDGADTQWGANDWGSISSAASLSPDGSLVFAAESRSPTTTAPILGAPGDDTTFAVWRRDGSILYTVQGSRPGDWAGWLDSSHLILGSVYGPNFPTRVIALTPTGPTFAFPDATGFYAARLPTDIV